MLHIKIIHNFASIIIFNAFLFIFFYDGRRLPAFSRVIFMKTSPSPITRSLSVYGLLLSCLVMSSQLLAQYTKWSLIKRWSQIKMLFLLLEFPLLTSWELRRIEIWITTAYFSKEEIYYKAISDRNLLDFCKQASLLVLQLVQYEQARGLQRVWDW